MGLRAIYAPLVPCPHVPDENTLADQTVALLQSLLEFAASRERVVVVLTLADVDDAYSRETEMLQQKLAQAQQISARMERILTPASEEETAPIVVHRLFRRVDRQAAR